jgi:YfiH family protein
LNFSFGFSIEPKGATPGLMKQVHSATLIEKNENASDREADGVFSEKEGEVFVFTADCLPVLFKGQKKIAAVHAGWRGTKLGIVKAMLSHFASESNLEVILGPCLKQCCFEVKTDFIQEFESARGSISEFLEQRKDKWFFDLVGFVIKRELTGLSSKQINLAHSRCTFCSSPTLPSYRRNKGTDPRIRAWIKRS